MIINISNQDIEFIHELEAKFPNIFLENDI